MQVGGTQGGSERIVLWVRWVSLACGAWLLLHYMIDGPSWPAGLIGFCVGSTANDAFRSLRGAKQSSDVPR